MAFFFYFMNGSHYHGFLVLFLIAHKIRLAINSDRFK
jgi:hypothetical protein